MRTVYAYSVCAQCTSAVYECSVRVHVYAYANKHVYVPIVQSAVGVSASPNALANVTVPPVAVGVNPVGIGPLVMSVALPPPGEYSEEERGEEGEEERGEEREEEREDERTGAPSIEASRSASLRPTSVLLRGWIPPNSLQCAGLGNASAPFASPKSMPSVIPVYGSSSTAAVCAARSEGRASMSRAALVRSGLPYAASCTTCCSVV
jgi:hypothetical protein